jgi:two-component sensor histidine kinase
VFGPETHDVFRQELFAFLDGRTTFESEARTRTLRGRPNEVSFRLSVVSGHERDWSRVVMSMFDLTRHKAAEKQIRSSLREKEVLLKEVHHRVKNNLQVISSLLSLQAQHLADPVARAMFGESQGRVRSIALVHEKLYQAKDLSHVRFDEYARELVEDLLHSLGGAGRSIDARIEVDEVAMPVTTAIPCGLIVNELVTNALKHAFPPSRGGTIRVALRPREDDRLELSVDDDGIGLPPALDPRRTPSLGLDLVYTFAQQLEAEVTVRRGDGTGFSFVFRSTGGSE